MSSDLQISAHDTIQRIQRIQVITIAWMIVEAAVSLWSAWRARSPALLAFGGDSAVELLSAAVVLKRFRSHIVDEAAERRAARIAGILLLVLAAYVAAVSAIALLGYSEPKPSYMGIAILLAAAAIMPWLAREKRRTPCGRSGISAVRLSLNHCPGRAGSPRILWSRMGGPNRSLGDCASHSAGGTRSPERQNL